MADSSFINFSADSLRALTDNESNHENCDYCDKSSVRSWDNITKKQADNISKIGVIENSNEHIENHGYTEHHPENTNYWSENAPIATEFYPYHESTICECDQCKALFMVYTEYAGHAPQKRIRYIKKELIC